MWHLGPHGRSCPWQPWPAQRWQGAVGMRQHGAMAALGSRQPHCPPCRSPSGSRLCLLQSIMALAHLQAAVLCVQAATALHHQQSED